ncbi:MAG: hypothetical protein R6W93_08475 [Candidatus Limnocylindrales bacterium]
MRTLRLSLVGTVMLALLGGFGGATVSAQSEEPLDPMGASFWTATFTDVEPPAIAFTAGPGYDEASGVASEGLVEASDPRISGRWRQVMDMRSYVSREPAGVPATVWTATARLDNEEGAWVGTFTGFLDGDVGREWNVLRGEGAYEGLTAVFRWLGEEYRQEGIIFPGDLPPLPDPIEPPAE